MSLNIKKLKKILNESNNSKKKSKKKSKKDKIKKEATEIKPKPIKNKHDSDINFFKESSGFSPSSGIESVVDAAPAQNSQQVEQLQESREVKTEEKKYDNIPGYDFRAADSIEVDRSSDTRSSVSNVASLDFVRPEPTFKATPRHAEDIPERNVPVIRDRQLDSGHTGNIAKYEREKIDEAKELRGRKASHIKEKYKRNAY